MHAPSKKAYIATSAQELIDAVVNRMQDPEPEGGATVRRLVAQRRQTVRGWLPILSLCCALGLLLVAYAYTASRAGEANKENLVWVGLLLMFVPSLYRLVLPIVDRRERIAILCMVGSSFYLVKVIASPLYFSFHDEYLHWRTVEDIARTSHLFSENPMLPVSPLYPGLELVTNACSELSGLDTFHTGLLVIACTRVIMILALFIIYEQITKSSRTASIATMIYMANPHFLFFDSLFSYESLALPLALMLLALLARSETIGEGQRRIIAVAWLVLSAVVITHHVTSYVLEGLLVLWVLASSILHKTPLKESRLAVTLMLGVAFSGSWVLILANPVIDYILSFLTTAIAELGNIVFGESTSRQLFVDHAGHITPMWERITMLASVGCIVLAVPFGLLCLWHRYRYNALAYMFGVAALAYPVSQLFRFTATGAELVDRSAAFIFVPMSFVLAILITQLWSVRRLRWTQHCTITALIAGIFLGGTLLGVGPTWAMLPGPYLVTADSRSIEPEGIATAQWAYSYLGPQQRSATDRTNRLLMLTYGDQQVITALQDKIDTAPLFYSPTFGAPQLALIRKARIRYLVVDTRLSTALPLLGFYFEEGETQGVQGQQQPLTSPISREALTKFNNVPQINRIFDSGDIIIYDLGGLLHATAQEQ